MRFHNLFFTLIFAVSILLVGCPSSEKPKSTGNKNSSPSNKQTAKSPSSNSNNPLKVKKTPTPEALNTADTIKPVVKTYCDAMRKKDDSALRKIYSRASLAQLQKDMREEGTKSLAEYLSSEPVGNKCDVRNEKIAGNTAVASVTTETYPNGVQLKFVKENGKWKMTTQSVDLDSVRKSKGK